MANSAPLDEWRHPQHNPKFFAQDEDGWTDLETPRNEIKGAM